MADHFRLLVIGAGPGGYFAALKALNWAPASPWSKSITSAAPA